MKYYQHFKLETKANSKTFTPIKRKKLREILSTFQNVNTSEWFIIQTDKNTKIHEILSTF